jgi:hypothetical protein
VWGSLKARTHPHGELNVRPCHCEVQEGADHAHILSLFHGLAIFVWIQCCGCAHQSRYGLELGNVELLHQVIRPPQITNRKKGPTAEIKKSSRKNEALEATTLPAFHPTEGRLISRETSSQAQVKGDET